MLANLEDSAVATSLENISFHSSPSQRRAKAKNIQTAIQLCSLHMLCSKSFRVGFSSRWTENLQIYKLGFQEAEEPEVKLPLFIES